MKRVGYLLTLLVLVLVSCEPGYTVPSGPSSGSNSYATPPAASFSMKTVQPLTVVLNNTSSNASSYKWDFGDGTTSTLKNPQHKYSSMGVYRIKLYAYADDKSYDMYEKNVTIENPKKIYFKGVIYEKLSVNNKYVKFTLTDDDFFTTTWVNSVYKLISTANLPYDFILATPKLMDGLSEDDYYEINVYYNNSSSGSGTKLQSFRFYTTTIYDGFPEKLSWSENNGNKISCLFKYE